MTNKKRMFAWGCNVWGQSLCPSLVAFPPDGDFKLYGDPGTYDELVRAFLGEREDTMGEIDEELAKEKWLSALFELERNPHRDQEMISEHRLVAEKLGWLTRK